MLCTVETIPQWKYKDNSQIGLSEDRLWIGNIPAMVSGDDKSSSHCRFISQLNQIFIFTYPSGADGRDVPHQ